MWRSLQGKRLSDDEVTQLDHIEADLLEHQPETLEEAKAMLEVVLANRGERSDELDRKALASIRDLLASLQLKGPLKPTSGLPS